MRFFTISEALVYLNAILPGAAPKNEETLRRAIRSGELKAEVSLGRAGSRIKEEDLIEYSKKYQKMTVNNAAGNSENTLLKMVIQDKKLADIPKLVDVMMAFGSRIETDKINYKIKLLETRSMWDEKRSAIQKNIDLLNEELQKCQSELNAIDLEISKT